MVETLVFLEQEDDMKNERKMYFLPRNGRNEEISIVLDRENRPTEAPPQPAKNEEQAWKQVLNWIRSDASGIKPGDEFTVQQVAAAFPSLKPDTVQKTLKRMAGYEKNRLEQTDRGTYRRKPPVEPDEYERLQQTL